MTYDVMKAWSQRAFEFNDHIQRRGNSWSGKFSFDSVEGQSIIHPDYELPPSPPQSPHSPPPFNTATSQWSPLAAAHVALRASPEPLCEAASPRHVDDVPSSEQTPLSSKDKETLAQKLYAAARSGDLAQVQLLISFGADVDTPVMVESLYDAFKPPKSGTLSPLAGAAGSHQLSAVKLLLDHGASLNPNMQTSSSSPLHQAYKADDAEIVRYLLEAGADINALNCYKTTPLMYAVKYASAGLVAELLAHKPDLHVLSFINTSAIHWTVWPGNAEVMELVLSAGADPNQKMGDGSTPLHCAATVGLTNMAVCLLRFGADPTIMNDDNETPAQVAEANGHAAVAQLLKDAESQGR